MPRIRPALMAVLASLPALCGTAHAQAAEPVLLRHATVIDGTGQPAQPDMDILIENGHITATGHGLKPPAHARVRDLSGLSVLPGLISDHSHVGQVSGTHNGAENYTRANILAELAQYEQYGVTTVVALGLNRSPLFDDLRREQHAGLNPGADLFGVDQGIGAPDGVPPENMFHIGADQVFRPTTPAETRAPRRVGEEQVNTVAVFRRDFIKIDTHQMTKTVVPRHDIEVGLLDAGRFWQQGIKQAARAFADALAADRLRRFARRQTG